MKCLILAAGYATRLYPLTESFPKPLLEVGGKTILDWLVDDIDEAHVVDQYVVISNDKFAGQFEHWAEGKKQKITVVNDGTNTNETRLGAVKDIQVAIDKLEIHDNLLIIAGDNVLDFSLTRFIRYAQERQASSIMRYQEDSVEKLKNCGVVEIDKADRVLSMEEKPQEPKSHWCCPPFYYYTQADSKRIPEAIASGCGTDAPGSLVAWLSGVSTVYAMEMPGKRFDVGNLAGYEKIKVEYKGIAGKV